MWSRPRKPFAIADRAGSGATLSPDKRLAFAYLRQEDRAAIEAVFAIDAAMGQVVRTTSEPMLGQIRLAWWRERLEELDAGGGAPAEPRLQAVASELLPRSIAGRDLARLETGWLRLFDLFPWEQGTIEAIWFRGRLLYALAVSVAGETSDEIEEAGGLWALVDAARHCSDPGSRDRLMGHARKLAQGLSGVRFPARLRPLSMLAALAVRDCRGAPPFEPEGSAGRAFAVMRHALTGRVRP